MSRNLNYSSKSLRLADLLREELPSLVSADGVLPSAEQLAKRYDASAHIVRYALRKLIDENLVVKQSNRLLKLATSAEGSANLDQLHHRTYTWVSWTTFDQRINRIFEGIQEFLREKSIAFRIISSPNRWEPGLEALANPELFCGDGVMVPSISYPPFYDLLRRLKERHFPVAIDGSPIPGIELPSVGVDGYGGSYQATMTLLLRYKCPVYFIYDTDSDDCMYRREGYAKAMFDAGFEEAATRMVINLGGECLNVEYWSQKQRNGLLQRVIEHCLEQLKFPASIVCTNDLIARMILKCAPMHRLTVGKDLRVIGFHDFPFAEQLTPKLSTIRSNDHFEGYRLAQVLHQQVLDKDCHVVHEKIPCEYIRRASD